MSDIIQLQGLVIVCGTAAFVASLLFLYRYLELKQERRVPNSVEGPSDRLERIELVVQATAIEVERIAEANRFMSKLLADQSARPSPASWPERVITPH